MSDRIHHPGPCLAAVRENASRAQSVLAAAAVARTADAMCRARGMRPRTQRLSLVARVAALRTPDLATALAAEGVPPAQARALAPHVARALDRHALDALAPGAWVALNCAAGVPAAEHGVLLGLGTLVVEAAEALAAPRARANAVVHIEPLERTPAPPWPGILAAGGLFGMAEPEVPKFLAEMRDRLVAHRTGVRAWLPGSGSAETTVAVRTPEGLLMFAPFVVTDPETLAELETVGLPDAALPAPVY